MVKYQIGNMWEDDADIHLVTTNSVVNTDGELVMGSGSALELKQRLPDVPRMFGNVIYNNKEKYYGLIIFEDWGVGAFQTKTSWRNNSTLELIEYSTNKLIEYCNTNPETTIFLPFPGIGHGGLTKDVVRPIVDKLPDTVTIWSLN